MYNKMRFVLALALLLTMTAPCFAEETPADDEMADRIDTPENADAAYSVPSILFSLSAIRAGSPPPARASA